MKKSILLVALLVLGLTTVGFAVQTGPSDNTTSTTNILSDGTSTDLISGDTVSVAAGDNVELSLSTPAGPLTLNVTPSENLEITMTLELSVPNGTLDDGLASIGFYLVVDTNNTDAEVDAEFDFPFDPSTLPDEVDFSSLHYRYYNATTDTWESVSSVVDTNNNRVVANTSHFSSWTVTGVTSQTAHDGDYIPVSLGTPVNIDPNASVVLETPSGVMVNLTVNESLEITFDEFDANPNASLPSDISSISPFTHVDINDTDANFNATMTMPYNSSVLPNGWEPEDLVMMYYNDTLSEWVSVDTLIDMENGTVNANTSHFSTWTSTYNNTADQAQNGDYVNVTLGKPVQVMPNSSVVLETPSGIMVNLTINESLEIVFDEFDVNPNASLPDDTSAISAFTHVDINDTDANFNATMTMPYNSSVLPDGWEPEDLVMMYYNDTLGEWVSVDTLIDTENGTLNANTSHFSTWTSTYNNTADQAQDGDYVNVTLGKPVAVNPNASVVLETPSGVMVNLTVNESLEITFDEFDVNPNASLPSQFSSISSFVHVDINDTDADFNATMSIPYNSSVLPDNWEPEDLVMMYYNDTLGEWVSVDTLVDTENGTLNANTTHFSTWTGSHNGSIPVIEPGEPYNVTEGAPVALTPGEILSLVTPSGIMVNVTVNESIEITFVENSTNPVGALPTDKVTFDNFLTIETNETADLNATLSIPIPSQVPADLNMSTLQLAFYNESSGEWEPVPSWSADGELHANTTHFSTWTFFGDAEETTTTTTSETTDDTTSDTTTTTSDTETTSDTSEDTEEPPATDGGTIPISMSLVVATLVAIPVVVRRMRNQ